MNITHMSIVFACSEYIAQVRISREAEEQEHSAAQRLSFDDTGCVSLVDVLKKCSVAGQIPVFYTGGLNIINNMIKTGSCLVRKGNQTLQNCVMLCMTGFNPHCEEAVQRMGFV